MQEICAAEDPAIRPRTVAVSSPFPEEVAARGTSGNADRGAAGSEHIGKRSSVLPPHLPLRRYSKPTLRVKERAGDFDCQVRRLQCRVVRQAPCETIRLLSNYGPFDVIQFGR